MGRHVRTLRRRPVRSWVGHVGFRAVLSTGSALITVYSSSGTADRHSRPARRTGTTKDQRKAATMRRRMLNGKIHRARVTDADLNYVGSVSIDPLLLKEADILPNEQVTVLNLMNGARFETYAIEGTEGQICLNGAAARLAQVDDLVIILTYVDVDEGDLAGHHPKVIFVDEENRRVDHA
jgi:aspartate 1-decarboxylase